MKLTKSQSKTGGILNSVDYNCWTSASQFISRKNNKLFHLNLWNLTSEYYCTGQCYLIIMSALNACCFGGRKIFNSLRKIDPHHHKHRAHPWSVAWNKFGSLSVEDGTSFRAWVDSRSRCPGTASITELLFQEN